MADSSGRFTLPRAGGSAAERPGRVFFSGEKARAATTCSAAALSGPSDRLSPRESEAEVRKCHNLFFDGQHAMIRGCEIGDRKWKRTLQLSESP
jgi:hypothetical protein